MSAEKVSPTIGRPRAADRHDIAAVGLRLFAERGYDNVTMSDIAAAGLISRSTLLRYFATKAHIVWDRAESETNLLRERLQATPPEEDCIEVLCRELPRSLVYSDEEIDLLRTQVTIIAGTVRGVDVLPPHMEALQRVLQDFIEARTGRPHDGVYARVLSRCLMSAGWTALLIWADSDEPRPDKIQREAFEYLRAGFPVAMG